MRAVDVSLNIIGLAVRRSRGALQTRAAAKELHFNKGGETLKRMQAGVDKLASVSPPVPRTLYCAESHFTATAPHNGCVQVHAYVS